MKNIFPLLSFLILLTSCYENLTCTNFKEGTFSMRADNKIFTIIRKGESQKEYINGVKSNNYSEPAHFIIEWVNDCSYRLKYDESKTEFGKREKDINENNGVLVEIIKINGKCMDYKASIIIKEGKIIQQNGVICKEF